MKLYVAYRMESLPVTYCDLEGHFCYVNPFFSRMRYDISGTAEARVVIQRALSTICLDINGMRTWVVISTVFSKTKDLSR